MHVLCAKGYALIGQLHNYVALEKHLDKCLNLRWLEHSAGKSEMHTVLNSLSGKRRPTNPGLPLPEPVSYSLNF